MNYNSVLDTFFSYSFWYVNLGVLFIFILIASYFRNKYLKKNSNKLWFDIPFGGMIVLWVFTFYLLNPVFIGYGYPRGVDGIVSKNGKVYVVDYLLVTGGKSASLSAGKCSRIHILDAKTGTKSRRFSLGKHGTLDEATGDSLFVSYPGSVEIYSASKGKLLATWDKKSLPGFFPQLSSGIDDISISHEQKSVKIKTLDGNHWNLSLQSAGTLLAYDPNKPEKKYVPTNQLYLFDNVELKIDDWQGGTTLMRLDCDDQTQEVRYLKNQHDSVADLKFLMGKFIAVSKLQKCFVVLSFETTKETGFMLTGISLDGKIKLWELKQSTLRPEDGLKYPLPICWNSDNNSEVLFFAMKDEVMAVEMATGKILWRQEL